MIFLVYLAFRGDFKRATELFNILKSEIPEPKPQTIKYFEELLKKNNQPLSLNLVSKSAEPVPFAAENTKTLMEHLEAKNAESALKELSSLKKGYIRTLSIKTLTDLVDLCLENKCVKGRKLATTFVIHYFKLKICTVPPVCIKPRVRTWKTERYQAIFQPGKIGEFHQNVLKSGK